MQIKLKEKLCAIANKYQADLYNFSRGHPFCFISDWHEEIFRAESAFKATKKLLGKKR